MKIYISGLYSGTNPQPGIGLARSLRAAYPNASLTGVEYSSRSSGLHWADFDELLLQRPWEELDLDTYATIIAQLLDSGAFWLSGIDLEIMWLASVFPEGHPNLLVPPGQAIRRIAKPAVEAHRGLPVRIPSFVSAAEHSEWDLHAFCRRHDWKVWLKGPYYEAVRTNTWDSVESARTAIKRAWSTDNVFIQAHVTGYEESVCFSAYRGELLGAAYMRKREITQEGKTWAGDIAEVPDEFAVPLQRIVKDLNWTGGAELEMVRDTNGQLWLIECNPRFPAWIHGATIAGRNLAAALVERASNVRARRTRVVCEEFARIVLEVPVRPEFPLPPLPEPYAGGFGHSLKHPSGNLVLADRLHKLKVIESERACDAEWAPRAQTQAPAPVVPPSFISDLNTFDFANLATPSWLFLESTAASLFRRAAEMSQRLSTDAIKVTNAYSIKTNPDERLMRLAYQSGFKAEAISLLEVQKALAVGFRPDEVILNGPGKWWPEGLLPASPLHAVFCDSIADLKRVASNMENGTLQAKIAGIRLRPPTVPSRFGIPADSPDALRALVGAVDALPRDCEFGVHFHMASSNVGIAQWWHLYDSLLRWCRAIETLTQRQIEHLDLGGGWFPDDWHIDSDARFAEAVERVRTHLPSVTQIISEPGKAMAQPTMALGMRLLEFEQSQGEIKQAIVDASIAELPMNVVQPHRILHQHARSGEWQPLRRGNTQLFGRLCMEHDIVATNVELPEHAQVGDLLVFCDAGAYDRSMSYVFGRG
jgi:diaminopimelate decarboxylase